MASQGCIRRQYTGGNNDHIDQVVGFPALSPGLTYDDLDGVADGAAAAGAFLRLASGSLPDAKEIAKLRSQLLAYCQRDTLTMVKVHRALMTMALGRPS